MVNRNEKRVNQQLMKQKKISPADMSSHGAVSQSHIPKVDPLDPDDQYVAIPGDIGMNRKPQNIRKPNDEDDLAPDDYENSPGPTYNDGDISYHGRNRHSSRFKVIPTYKSKKTKRDTNASNTTTNTQSNQSSNTPTSMISNGSNHRISTNTNISNKSEGTAISDSERQDIEMMEDDDYAEIPDSIRNLSYKDKSSKIKQVAHKSKTEVIELKKPNRSYELKGDNNNNNNNNNQRKESYRAEKYHSSPPKGRRYSAELEFNAAKIRKRQSSKFNKNFDHSHHTTQDDMIFLDMEQYINDDGIMEDEEQKSHLDVLFNNNDNNNNNNNQKDKASKPRNGFNDVVIEIGNGNYDSGNETEDDPTNRVNAGSIVEDLLNLTPPSTKLQNNKDRKRDKNKIKPRNSLRSKEDFMRMSTRRVIKLFAPQEIKYSDIDFGKHRKEIGKGSFGRVVKAKYHQIDVAVKTLHTQKLTGAELLNFKREAAIMQKVGGHKHIARMYGFCTKPEICIVTEYYANGSLYDILKENKFKNGNSIKNGKKKNGRHNNGKSILSTERKIQMSIEASLGIWHLHQQQVIHRDISARNLLVDENWTVVVADLGMSHLKTRKNGSFHVKSNVGPVKWMAPESIIGHEYSEKTDSYSFGITLYEIFSESEPYPGLLPLEAGAKVVHEGLRPKISDNRKIKKIPNLEKLLKMLWKPQPKDRPDFLFITDALRKIKQQWITVVTSRSAK